MKNKRPAYLSAKSLSSGQQKSLVKNVSDASFDAEVLGSDLPVLWTFGPLGAAHARWLAQSSRNWPRNMKAALRWLRLTPRIILASLAKWACVPFPP